MAQIDDSAEAWVNAGLVVCGRRSQGSVAHRGKKALYAMKMVMAGLLAVPNGDLGLEALGLEDLPGGYFKASFLAAAAAYLATL